MSASPENQISAWIVNTYEAESGLEATLAERRHITELVGKSSAVEKLIERELPPHEGGQDA